MKNIKIGQTVILAAEETDIYVVTVEMKSASFGIMSSGEEVIGDQFTTLTFKYRNKEDAEKAKAAAEGFGGDGVQVAAGITPAKGVGYPVFKEELFLKILKDAVDPKISQTVKRYRRDKYRRRRY